MNAPEVEIRVASDADIERVLELWAAARSSYATTVDTPEAVAVLRARDPGSLLVAERGGRVVGTLIAAFDGWRGGMYRLVVEPDERRQGIGAALIGAGEARLYASGARRISVLVGFGDDFAARPGSGGLPPRLEDRPAGQERLLGANGAEGSHGGTVGMPRRPYPFVRTIG